MRQAKQARIPKAAAALATFVVLMSLGVAVNADPVGKGNPPASAGNGNGNPGCSESNNSNGNNGNAGNWHNGNPFNNGNHVNAGCENEESDEASPVVDAVTDPVANDNGSSEAGNGNHGNPDCNGTGPERTCDEDGDHNQGGPCDGNERVKDECDSDDPGDDPGDPGKGSMTLDKSGPAEAHSGEAIEYTFVMANTGNGAITHLVLTDTLLGITHNFKHPLTPHKSVTFSAVYAIPGSASGVMVNEATACGISHGAELCATDQHSVVIGSAAGIVVRKSVSAESVDPGQTVTYTYEVENVGDGDLSAVTVDDDILGHVGDADLLGAGQTATFTKDYTVQADSPSENIATACGTNGAGEQVCNTDSARINILLPAGPRRSGDGKLPKTGFSVILWLASGLTLIALGLAMTQQRRLMKV